ncbi:MAG TPA: flagellar motor protein MotD [Steroidobacteraceae bacterium]|nr:flagellar motor protein MotD [Steroidobacteraceae bacterium]
MRRRKHDDHLNPEAWAIPYGDLITLLLAFFVVMYAMSSVNEGKYRLLSDALNAEFRGKPTTKDPIQLGQKQKVLDGDTESDRVTYEPAPPPEQKLIDSQQVAAAAEKTAAALDHVASDVEKTMSSLIQENLVAVRRHGLWVEVEIQTDILFGSGSATLSPLAVNVLQQLADAIKPFNNPVRVEGHTDNVPINTPAFPSNWELSAARAASVVHLFTARGFDPKRLTVIGLGSERPAKSNATAPGRNANRRVVLVILGTDGLPEGSYGYERGKNEPPPVGANVNGVMETGPALEAAGKATTTK